MSKAEEKLIQLGFNLPIAPKPVAAYVPGVLDGNLIYISGQLPMQNATLITGKLGDDLRVEDGYAAAQICALNCLGVLKSILGDLDRVERIVKITGFVNCTSNFDAQPKVINGASELLGNVFGDIGQHARSAVGAAALPLGAACEVEMIVRVR